MGGVSEKFLAFSVHNANKKTISLTFSPAHSGLSAAQKENISNDRLTKICLDFLSICTNLHEISGLAPTHSFGSLQGGY
jgi:hypothetical protein